MEDLHQAAGTHLDLFTEPAHGNPVQIMHHDRSGDQLVTIQVAGKDTGDPGQENLLTFRVISFAQPV
jgi:hypothetical protein